MSKFWKIDPEVPTENFGPMLPNGRNAYGMSPADIYFAIHGKTERQARKEIENDD